MRGDYEVTPDLPVRLDVSYPLAGNGVARADRLIELAAGKESVDSGAGFGFRDLGFEFATEAEADEAMGKVERLGISGLRASVFTQDDVACEHMEEVLDFVLDFEERTAVKLRVSMSCEFCHCHRVVVAPAGMGRHDPRKVDLMRKINEVIRKADLSPEGT